MIKSVNHLAISTGDVDRLSAFYRSQLGFVDVFAREWGPGYAMADRITELPNSKARVVMLGLGSVHLELFQFHQPTPVQNNPPRRACDHGFTHLCLEVQDLYAEYKRLLANGMTFHCPPQALTEDMLATYGRDPDGNIIELIEVLP
jgi:catechol 2,3-dioxygenase-like lactoylglutathione lyase family enzyme